MNMNTTNGELVTANLASGDIDIACGDEGTFVNAFTKVAAECAVVDGFVCHDYDPNELLERIHPCAGYYDVLPRDDTVRAITNNMREIGQQVPVVVVSEPNGESLGDGVNRCLASIELGRSVRGRVINAEWLGSQGTTLVEYITRLNRSAGVGRQLEPVDLVLLAANMCIKVYGPQARARKKAGVEVPKGKGGRAHEIAARVHGAPTESVRLAKTFVMFPRLVDLVRKKELTIFQASKLAKYAKSDRLETKIEAMRRKKSAPRRQRATRKSSLGSRSDDQLLVIPIAKSRNELASRIERMCRDYVGVDRNRWLELPQMLAAMAARFEQDSPFAADAHETPNTSKDTDDLDDLDDWDASSDATPWAIRATTDPITPTSVQP